MTENDEIRVLFGHSRALRLLSAPDQRRLARAAKLIGGVIAIDGTPAECYSRALAVVQLMHERMAVLVEDAMTS